MSIVSVVIPARDPGQLLERAVRSVLAQTMGDFELIIVEDGSSTPQPEIKDLDSRIRYHAQQNRGVSIARNVGVRMASSHLVAFLDHDDEWLPDKLTRQLELVHSQPEAAFWLTGFDWTWADRSAVGIHTEVTYYDQLALRTTILPSTVILRASDYLDVGGSDPLYTNVQDIDLFLRLSMEGRVPAVLPESLVRYHLHDSNASRNFRKSMRNWRRLHDLHEERARRLGDHDALLAIASGRKRAAELFAYQALDAARREKNTDVGSAIRQLGFAIRTSPTVGMVGMGSAVWQRAKRAASRTQEPPRPDRRDTNS